MKRLLALCLIVLIARPQAAFAQVPVEWDAVQHLPPGTRLKLIFRNGTEVTGNVVQTTPDDVTMRENEPGPSGLRLPGSGTVSLRDNITFERVETTDVILVDLATSFESTNGEPNATAVRYIVRTLGVGKKLDFKTGRRHVRAKLVTIGDDFFDVADGPSTLRVPYGDVTAMKPAGLHWGVKTALIGGGIYGGLMLLMLLCYASGSCTA